MTTPQLLIITLRHPICYLNIRALSNFPMPAGMDTLKEEWEREEEEEEAEEGPFTISRFQINPNSCLRLAVAISIK